MNMIAVRDVAALLGVSTRFVRELIQSGVFKTAKREWDSPNARWLVAESEVTAYLKKKKPAGAN